MDRTTSRPSPPFPSPPLSAPVLTQAGWLVDRMDLMLEWLTAVDDLRALAVRLEVADGEPRR